MVKAKHWINSYWQICLTVFVSFMALFLLLFIHIKSINPNYNAAELNIHNNLVLHNYGLHYLWHNLINFPYTLGLVMADKTHYYGLLSIRSVGALFGFISAIVFFWITYQWYEKITAILATILFVANFWFLENTRSGGVASLYPLALLVIIASIVLFNRVKKPKYSILILAAVLVLTSYISGMIWFLAIGLILRRKNILNRLKEVSLKLKIEAGAIGFVLILPLLWYIYNAPERLRSLLGLPAKLLTLKTYLLNFVKFPLHIFIINNHSSYLTIGRLPMIDIFGTVLFLLGVYWSWVQYRFMRTGVLGIGLLISWVLASLGIIPGFLAYPFILLFIASGIFYLLARWFRVFPTNPFARASGVIILSAAILVLAFYHTNQYYVVWPHTQPTLSAYSYPVK